MLFRIVVMLLALSSASYAQTTPCPTIVDNISVMSVVVTGSPQPIQTANYDLARNNLTVIYPSQNAVIFVAVPRSLVQSGKISWAVLNGYHPGLMQNRSVCPLLTQDNKILETRPNGTPIPSSTGLLNDHGVLQLNVPATGWPTSSAGLSPGAVWNNGFTVAVIPGMTPNPLAPPVFFNAISAPSLLSLGGGNLPLTNPGVPNQLWNNAGLVCIS